MSAFSSPDIPACDLTEGSLAQTSWLCTKDAVKDDPSPQGRLGTFFDSEEEDESPVEDDLSSVSPLSATSESCRNQRNNRIDLSPEFSSHSHVVSSVDLDSHEYPRLTSSQAQSEDKRSADATPATKKQLNAPTSAYQDGNYDTSSCYSRRNSWTSMFSECSGDRPIRYSVTSPVSAGVFDDSMPVLHDSPAKSSLRSGSVNDKIKTRLLSLRRCISPPIKGHPAVDVESSLSPCRTRIGNGLYTDTRTPSQPTEEEDSMAEATKRVSGQSQAPGITGHTSETNEGDTNGIALVPAQHQPGENAREGFETALPPKKLGFQKKDKVEKSGDAGWTKKHGKNKRVRFILPLFQMSRKNRHGHGPTRTSSSSASSSRTVDTMRKSQDDDCITPRLNEVKARETPSKNHSLINKDHFKKSSFSASAEGGIRPQLPRSQTTDSACLKDLSDIGSFSSSANEIGNIGNQDLVTKHAKPGSKEDGIDILFKKGFVSCSRNQQPADTSFGQTPEVLYELNAGLPSPSIVMNSSSRKRVCVFPTNTPDKAILSILNYVDSLVDLFSAAVVNKHFYRVFKQHELPLIKRTLFKMSPAAWELREMSPPWDPRRHFLLDPDAQVPEYTPNIYLRCYAQDIITMVHLKMFILARCGPFLRPETSLGLAAMDFDLGDRMDAAVWRIWTFCRIFGCGKNREVDIDGQLDWLNGGTMAMDRHKHSMDLSSASVSDSFGINSVLLEPPSGFAKGNEGGLSSMELYDMTEIWVCLGVLLQPLLSEVVEAREAGIYDGHDVQVGDVSKEEEILEEWTYYVLTLGLPAVLFLSSVCPEESAASKFRKARKIGLTRWEAQETGMSRSVFFKEAVSRAFASRRKDQVRRNQSFEPPTQTCQSASTTNGSNNAKNTTLFEPLSKSNSAQMTNNIHPSMRTDGPIRRPVHHFKRAAFAGVHKEEQLQYLQLQQQLQQQHDRRKLQQRQQQSQHQPQHPERHQQSQLQLQHDQQRLQQRQQQSQHQRQHPERHQQQQNQPANINEAAYSFATERPLSNFSNVINSLL